jgi:superfamily II DNA helicase RecQ
MKRIGACAGSVRFATLKTSHHGTVASLSSWGHDFRKSYLQLDYLRTAFPKVPLLACTATATTKVIADIKTVLHLEQCPCHIGSFDRPNIFYKVKYKDLLNAEKPEGALDDLAAFVGKQSDRCRKKERPFSGIVYVHTRQDTIEVANALQKRTRLATGMYHGGMKAADRTKVLEDWTSGNCVVVVATVAFGMGYVVCCSC